MFVCLDDDDDEYRSLHEQICTTGVTARLIHNSSWIAFCPDFFDASRRGRDFPGRGDCPVVSWRLNRFGVGEEEKRRGGKLMQSLYSIFLEQMLRLHLHIDDEREKGQVLALQECVELDAAKSLGNVGSWVFYAAGECCFSFFFPFGTCVIRGMGS